MDYRDKIYFVLPVDMLVQISLDALEENSYEEVRRSVDETMAIVEYKGTFEAFGGTFLTHSQALDLMNTPEWSAPEEGGV